MKGIANDTPAAAPATHPKKDLILSANTSNTMDSVDNMGTTNTAEKVCIVH